MLENRNTENAPLDAEDWEIVFAPYVEHPLLAQSMIDVLTLPMFR